MSGYTVTNSIDLIDEYCNNPGHYKAWQLKEAIKDAEQHYLHGNASKEWFEHVKRTLTPFT